MLHLLVRVPLAAVLAAAAVTKLLRPRQSRDGLWQLVTSAPFTSRAAGPSDGAAATAVWAVAVAVELGLAAGVAAGSDAAAAGAAALMAGGAAAIALALRAGRAGMPCGCLGSRSRISGRAAWRAGLLAVAFGLLPALPHDAGPPAAAVAVAAVAGLGVVALAVRRELAAPRVGERLDDPREGPPLGAESALAGCVDPAPADDRSFLGLALFTSADCERCPRLEHAAPAIARSRRATLVALDEARDAPHWQRLSVPGSPYAVAFDARGRVLAKGRARTLAQLHAVLVAGDQRRQTLAELVGQRG